MPWSQVILNPKRNPVIKMSIKSDKARMSIPTDIAKLIGLDKPNVLVDLFVGYGPEFGQLKMASAKNGKGGKIVRKPGAATLNFQFPAPSLWGERQSDLVRVDFTVVGDELIVNTPFYEETHDAPLPGNTKVTNALGQQIIFHYTQGQVTRQGRRTDRCLGTDGDRLYQHAGNQAAARGNAGTVAAEARGNGRDPQPPARAGHPLPTA